MWKLWEMTVMRWLPLEAFTGSKWAKQGTFTPIFRKKINFKKPRGAQAAHQNFWKMTFFPKYVENSAFNCFLSTRLWPLSILYARQLFSCPFQSRFRGRFTGTRHLVKILTKFFIRSVWLNLRVIKDTDRNIAPILMGMVFLEMA